MVNFSLFFLFLLLLPIPTFSANHRRRRHPLPPPSPHPPPPARPSHPPPPPPRTHPPPPPLHQHQVNNIIDALIGAGDFNNWASMLSTTHFFMLPLSATLFVPSDDSLFPFPIPVPTSTTAATDPLNIPYHIVPQRLTFSQLTLFKPFSRLPTLLPSRSLLITNASSSNFTLDASQISHPDLYLTSQLAVHGIASLLNYSVFGGGSGIAPPLLQPPPPPPPTVLRPLGDPMGDGRRSDAGCLYGEFAFVFLLIPWVVWIIKIHGNPLGL